MNAGGVRGAIGSGLALGACTALVLAVVDAGEALARIRFATLAGALLLVAPVVSTLIVLGAVLGALGGFFAAASDELARTPRKARAVAALLGLALGAPALAVEIGWIVGMVSRLSVQKLLIAALVVVATAGVAFGAARLLLAPQAFASGRRRRVVAALAASVAALLLLVERSLPAEIYPETQALLALHGALAAVVAVQWTARSLPSPLDVTRPFVAVAAFAGAAFVALEALNVQPASATQTMLYGKLAGPLRRATDFDRDGSSSLFGGRDCRAFDARFAPKNPDSPGNGLDEDCSGRDAERPASEAKPSYAVPEGRRFNVVWIGIDALRADHVGAYGYARSVTPNIDRLAESGLRFERAYAQSTGTWDSVPSMLTGRYPHRLVRDYEHPSALAGKRWYAYRLSLESPMLSDLLERHGYVTGGFASFRLFHWLGFDARFTTYERSEDHVASARAFIASAREPFLLWHHLPYPHEPYEAKPGFAFGDEDVDRYDSEIAFSDAIVGEIVKELRQRGAFERTIFVVTADHGEAFGEHERKFHARSCYDEQLRVPLVVRIPGVPAALLRSPVELVDLVPTLLEILDVPFTASELDGTSLLASAAAGERVGHAYCEYLERSGVTLESLATRDWKLISDHRRDTIELYSLARDPGELVNVAGEEPLVRERLLSELGRFRAAAVAARAERR